MTGWNLLNADNSVTRIGIETTLAVAATTMVNLTCEGDTMPMKGMTQKMLPNKSQRTSRHAYVPPVKGLKIDSPVELSVAMKGLPARLNVGATPVVYTDPAALSHQILNALFFGGELTPAAGSTVTTGSTTTSLILPTGHGARFAVGQVLVCTTASGLEVRLVGAIATDTITPIPAFAGIPSLGQEVRNAYCYFPVESNTTTFTIDHTYVESGTPENQRRSRGCTADISVELKVGEVPLYKLAGKATDWDGPGNLSLPMTQVDEDMTGGELCWEPQIFFADPTAGAPSLAAISTIKFSIPHQYQRVPGPGPQSTVALTDVASRDKQIVVELSGHMGTAEWTAFNSNSGSSRLLIAYTQTGSGTSASLAGYVFNGLLPLEPPLETKDGELVFFSGKYLALQNTHFGGATDLARANVIAFMA